MGTGGGEPVILSSSDKEILDIMCPEVIYGIQNVPETPIVFETYKVGSLILYQNIYILYNLSF